MIEMGILCLLGAQWCQQVPTCGFTGGKKKKKNAAV